MNLRKKAWEIRLELLKMFGQGKAHHFGGSLSCAEIVTALYFYKMRYSKETMKDPLRDRFIMSKGHCVPTQYVALSMLGIIPHEQLATLKHFGSPLQGHPDIRKTPGLEACTGSLGQGLSVANEMAIAALIDGLPSRFFVVAGDGEIQEGQIWEAMMTAAHYKLGNVCLIVDHNHYQSQGNTDETMNPPSLEACFHAFGWRSVEIDGHDIHALCRTLDAMEDHKDKPLAIIADTVKGRGIPSIEKSFKGHNYSMTEEEFSEALASVEKVWKEMEE